MDCAYSRLLVRLQFTSPEHTMGSHRTSTADKPTAEMAGGAGTGKFITVKFGNNESLLCNADCLAANLLRSLVARAHLPGDWGVSPQPDRAVSVDARVIDLTDTSGVRDFGFGLNLKQ